MVPVRPPSPSFPLCLLRPPPSPFSSPVPSLFSPRSGPLPLPHRRPFSSGRVVGCAANDGRPRQFPAAAKCSGERGPTVDGCVGYGGPCGDRPPPLLSLRIPRRRCPPTHLRTGRPPAPLFVLAGQRRFSHAAPSSPLPATCTPSGCGVGSAAASPGASAVESPPGAAGSAAPGGRRCISCRLPRHGSSSSPRLYRLSFYSGRWLTTIHHCTSLPQGIRGPWERKTLRTQPAQLVSSGRLAVLPQPHHRRRHSIGKLAPPLLRGFVGTSIGRKAGFSHPFLRPPVPSLARRRHKIDRIIWTHDLSLPNFFWRIRSIGSSLHRAWGERWWARGLSPIDRWTHSLSPINRIYQEHHHFMRNKTQPFLLGWVSRWEPNDISWRPHHVQRAIRLFFFFGSNAELNGMAN